MDHGLMVDLMIDLGDQRSTRSHCNITIEKEQIACSNFGQTRVKTVQFGLNSIRSLTARVWKLVPDELTAIKSLNVFNEKIKGFEFKCCPYNLCKGYIQGVGSMILTPMFVPTCKCFYPLNSYVYCK